MCVACAFDYYTRPWPDSDSKSCHCQFFHMYSMNLFILLSASVFFAPKLFLHNIIIYIHIMYMIAHTNWVI